MLDGLRSTVTAAEERLGYTSNTGCKKHEDRQRLGIGELTKYLAVFPKIFLNTELYRWTRLHQPQIG